MIKTAVISALCSLATFVATRIYDRQPNRVNALDEMLRKYEELSYKYLELSEKYSNLYRELQIIKNESHQRQIKIEQLEAKITLKQYD